MTSDHDLLMILKEALNQLNEGIQIYDAEGRIVYFDPASKKLLETDSVEQRHLLDVYDVSEDESTVLTALRSQAPVRNRYAHYFSTMGRELTTVNNAYPLFDDGKLVGAVNIEEDIRLIRQRAARAQETQQAMQEKLSRPAGQNKASHYTFRDLIGRHPRILQVKELAQRVAMQDSNVMIVGETGTGKEIVAQSIHYASSRKEKPFVALNCAAVPETLIESILFGTTKGSFTGSSERPGLFREADGGTLFLDELNSMSLTMQSKVLRVLQEGSFRPVGSSKEMRANVRVISSCNQNPLELMERQKLRNDLFYRLAAIVLELPPLRERTEDIEALVEARIQQNQERYVFPFTRIEPDTLRKLQEYTWPGNVRELFHVVDYAMNVADDPVFRPSCLPDYCFHDRKSSESLSGSGSGSIDADAPLQEQVAQFEAAVIERTLRACQGNISQAARKLGLPRQNLQYRIRKYNIWR